MQADFSGSWLAVIEECTFVTRTPVRLTANIMQSANMLHVEMHVSFDGDGDSRMVFDAPIVSADDAGGGRVAQARWMGDDLVVETRIESGGEEYVLRDRWWLSAGGERLTMAHKDDVIAGQTVVFKRA